MLLSHVFVNFKNMQQVNLVFLFALLTLSTDHSVLLSFEFCFEVDHYLQESSSLR